jgi:hypothetical protein
MGIVLAAAKITGLLVEPDQRAAPARFPHTGDEIDPQGQPPTLPTAVWIDPPKETPSSQ